MKSHLFRENLRCLRKHSPVEVADDSIFHLPEKVLQFGAGVLLRGLPDFFIDKANRQGIFNGRIVVVKTTSPGDIRSFEKQDNLYTICTRDLADGKTIEENIISSAISRVLSAKSQWSLVLDLAKNPNIAVIISNATELGIKLVQDDIYQWPPVSFPGKILAFLYARYVSFGGSTDSGLIILPTELIPNNGARLEAIVMELAHRNGLESAFIDWLEKHNDFCNSLVDRIVPGLPDETVKNEIESVLGYTDDLMIVTEKYRLWAIEGDERIRQKLSFEQADSGVVIQPDIEVFRELKLYLLNGAHTAGAALAYLCGFQTVSEAMENTSFSTFLVHLMEDEIAIAIPYPVERSVVLNFTQMVLDRFRNPFMEHKWSSIAQNYSAKIEARVLPVFFQYLEKQKVLPEYTTFAIAAYLLFMKVVRKNGDGYFAKSGDTFYQIQDPQAPLFYQYWQTGKLPGVVGSLLGEQAIWGQNLGRIEGLTRQVTSHVELLTNKDPLEALATFLSKAEYV
ncbi:Altronate oxidoreductase [Dyadobacter sp. CECT 9275]|uniref:Altronate oxidoreductase n=1 Tax=Dyadobacter helix TaxID=2822344 RepID=A0A916JEL6_9BACT|nr:tagaturonate reductase [Dyadobacter sp. CECT 9275]CAG5004896.1 Altronate oxidoreductase [Dyadobacter sp. CECT 9275]